MSAPSQSQNLPFAQHSPQSHRHVPPAQHSHLHILDAIAVGIIITLVPNAVVVSVLLPRIRCQAAVVLQAQPALKMGRR